MEFKIHGSNIEVTDAIKEYVIEKVGKLDKYLENPDSVHANVSLRVKGVAQTIEITIPVKKFILRAESTEKDLYSAIDMVVDKLERQIKKQKSKMNSKAHKEHLGDFFAVFDIEDLRKELNNEDVVKRKEIELKPMSEDEAMLQLEMLGHEFFVFKEVESDSICVMYRRKDNNYGVIKTN